jgi:small subunit ribosomal protein S15
MALTKEQKAELVAKFGANDKDTGSVKVQIALLTVQIQQLTAHLKKNIHDASSRRGLQILLGKRRGLLDYYKANDVKGYAEFIKEIGLRK